MSGISGHSESDVLIDTLDGPMRCMVVRPPGTGPAVIMYPHVGGLTVTMRGMAEHVAAAGYLCIVPDLYHRLGTVVVDPQSDAEDVIAIRKIAAASISDAGAMRDTQGIFRWL